MVVGFNHNFNYKGQTYHVQTEDSGIKNPHIITLLYRGGTILASKKTSYADIIKVDHLETVVEDLMKSQHREMLRLLKNGDFDSLLGLPTTAPQVVATTAKDTPTPAEKTTVSTPPRPHTPPAAAVTSTPPTPTVRPPAPADPPLPAKEKVPEKKVPERPTSPAALTLDDIILSYMVGEERKK